MRIHAGGDMLKAHRHFDACFAKRFCYAVQQMRRGDIAHGSAFPALVFEQIIIQQHEHVVGGNIPPLLVNDAEPVRVSVRRNAQVGMMIRHRTLKIPQRIGIGRGQMTAEECIVAVVDHVNVAARSEQNGHQARQAHAVHGIKHHARPACADGVHVDLLHDRIQIRIARINEAHPAGFQCLLKGDDLNLAIRKCIGLLTERTGYLLRGVPSTAGKELDAVVDRRIMAGRYGCAIGEVSILHGKHDLRRRCGEIDKVQPHALASHHLRKPDCRFPAEKAPVIADTETFLFHAFALHAPRQRARYAPDICLGEAIADDFTPAACTKPDHLSCLLSPSLPRRYACLL